MTHSAESESPVAPESVSPEVTENGDTGLVRRASDLKFAALDYEHAEIPQLPPPDEKTPPEPQPEKAELIPAATPAASPKPEPAEQETYPEPPIRGILIPPILSWMLGFMALLLFLVAAGILIAYFWDSIPMIVRVCTLVAIPSFLWVVYIIGFRKGMRSAELASLFAAISWLDAVLIYQFCIQTLPVWIMGSIFVFGLMLIPLIKPWKTAVWVLFAGGILQFGLMGYGMTKAVTYGEWSLIWASAMAMMMIWSHIGSWCALTKRESYGIYSFLGPFAQFIFLLMVITLLVYPQQLVPATLNPDIAWGEWIPILSVWITAMLPILPLQRHFAEVCNHPNISNSFLLYWSLSIITVPLGLLLVTNIHTLLLLPLILGYLFSMVYYGADYRVPSLVLMGSVGIFLSIISIPIHLGTGAIGSAIIIFLLSLCFFFCMLGLNARRKKIIRLRREELETMREVERERRKVKTYHEKERFSFDLTEHSK